MTAPGRRGVSQSTLAVAAAVVVLAVLAARQQAFVGRYAVDVLYGDDWDLYKPLFYGRSWWATFDQQHGPHRQGLGGLLLRVLATHTRWDTRYAADAVSASLIAAAALGVWLAWRCGVRGWPVVAVPVAYLNGRQYSMLVASANPSHGALPVLLLTGLCLTWFVRRTGVRLTLGVLLTSGLIFTGFGVFAGVLTPLVLGAEVYVAVRRHDRRRAAVVSAALAGVAAAWAVFAVGYRFEAELSTFRFPADRPVEYAYFVGVLLANVVGVGAGTPSWGPTPAGWGTIGVGLAIFAVGGAVAVVRGRRVLRDGDPASVAIFLFAAFGAVFAADAAVGRVPLGWRTGDASRYVTLCVPTALAILLHLGSSPRLAARRAAVVCGLLLAAGTLFPHATDWRYVDWLHDGCLRWRAAYLVTGDQVAAERLAGFQTCPRPELNERIECLRRNHFNLFDPDVFADLPRAGAAASAATVGR